MKKYEFTYTIKNVDLQHGDILTEYIPADTRLLSYTYNVGAYGYNTDGTLKTVEQTIMDNAPHHMWETQEMLLTNFDNILNKSGTINPNV